MKYKTLSISYIATVITGLIGVIVIKPVMAQILENPLPSQMAQSTSTSLSGDWRLVNMTETATPTPMLPTAELTAEFANGRISGSGGCNRFNGSYETQGEQLSVGPLASTFKACEQPILDQETRYFQALQAAQRYEVNDQGQLSIFYRNKQGEGVLRFTTQTARGLW